MAVLRVLHVTPYYEGAWAYGGIPRVAATLARGLARRGHRITVCTTDAASEHARLARAGAPARRLRPWPPVPGADGVELRVFPNVSNRLAYRWQLFVPVGLDGYLRRHAGDFDVAHVHGCHHLPGARAARHLRRAGVPYVLAPNGTGPRIERRRLAKRVFDLTLGRSLWPGVARALAVTEAERRQLVGLGLDPRSITVVPNPVDLAEFDTPPPADPFRRRLGLAGARVVLFLGQLTPRKSVDVLVRAVARLARPEIRLVVAGNDRGPGPALRRLVRALGLEPVTTFTGVLAGRERLEALAAADVVAYPSRQEVFGLVPLEALLAGTPVVVADDCGAAEVIGRTGGGVTVPPGDPPALAEAIRGILEAPGAWGGAVAAAQPRVRELYGGDAVCARIETLYSELVAAGA